MPARKPIIAGDRFGRLTVLSGNRWRQPTCECRCDCGAVMSVEVGRLRSGNTKSCGCLANDVRGAKQITHGHTRGGDSPTYNSWTAMRARARYAQHYPNYQRRGIAVCDRWQKFENFLEDMGKRPPGLTLERIDNAKGYEPGNCRWATKKEQGRNTSRNKYLTFRGDTKSLAEWAEVLGMNYSAVKQRINKLGWDVDRAFTTPVYGKTDSVPKDYKPESP